MAFFSTLIFPVIIFVFTGCMSFEKRSTKPISLADSINFKSCPCDTPIQPIPDHLTQKFWKDATPSSLKRKLKTIENVNEVRSDNNQSMLHLLILYGKYPEMISQLFQVGVDFRIKDNHKNGTQTHALLYLPVAKKDPKVFLL